MTYTVFPLSAYKTANVDLAIYNVQIENDGSKEAEDVRVAFVFTPNAILSDFSVEPSSKVITYTVDNPKDLKNAVVRIPILNAGESVKFSFLAENASQFLTKNAKPENVQVSLRGKGVVGIESKTKRAILNQWIVAILIVLLLVIMTNVVRGIWRSLMR